MKFKELTGTLAKVQGIFHVLNVALNIYSVVTPFTYLKWNMLRVNNREEKSVEHAFEPSINYSESKVTSVYRT